MFIVSAMACHRFLPGKPANMVLYPANSMPQRSRTRQAGLPGAAFIPV
jgi:hypothetical protein